MTPLTESQGRTEGGGGGGDRGGGGGGVGLGSRQIQIIPGDIPVGCDASQLSQNILPP